MKLSDILRVSENQGADFSFVIADVDVFEPDQYIIHPFKIRVEYNVGPESHEDHPYGDGTARENFKGELNIKGVYTEEPVPLLSTEDETKIVKTIPKGAPVQRIPGYKASLDAWFYEQAEKDQDTR